SARLQLIARLRWRAPRARSSSGPATGPRHAESASPLPEASPAAALLLPAQPGGWTQPPDHPPPTAPPWPSGHSPGSGPPGEGAAGVELPFRPGGPRELGRDRAGCRWDGEEGSPCPWTGSFWPPCELS